MKELDKLEKYLQDNDIDFIRIDKGGTEINTLMGRAIVGERHQIIMEDWDVICQPDSYGWKEGLLELSGSLVRPEFAEDGVEGWLTARDIINRLEKTLKQPKNIIIQIDRIATDPDNFDMFHVKGTNTLWLTKGQLDRLLDMNNIQKEVFYERLYTKTSCSCK